MTSPEIPIALLEPLRSLAIAVIDNDGRLQWSNAGFRHLLPERLREGKGIDARPYVLSPSLGELQAMARTQKAPCYQGLLTFGDPNDRPQSLSASVHPRDDGLLILAEHDVDELTRISEAAMRLSSDLTQSQRELIAMNRRLAEREAQIHSLSITDQLTGLGNRRRLDEALNAAIHAALRDGTPFSVVMVDLDHFKAVNDAFGHAIGDELLQALGQALADGVRDSDTVCRFGGEEFAIIMPGLSIADAHNCSERLRAQVARLRTTDQAPAVTATFGIAEWQSGDNADTLLQRADKCLYQGKAAGRNCVISSGDGRQAALPLSATERARQNWSSSAKRITQAPAPPLNRRGEP